GSTGTDPRQDTTLPCQRRAYADPKAATALVRNFTTHRSKGEPRLAAVQAMELSTNVDRAKAGYDAATGWFAECLVPQMQLLSVHRVKGLGEEAEQFALRAWQQPAMTLVVGVARTGRITTMALTR